MFFLTFYLTNLGLKGHFIFVSRVKFQLSSVLFALISHIENKPKSENKIKGNKKLKKFHQLYFKLFIMKIDINIEILNIE